MDLDGNDTSIFDGVFQLSSQTLSVALSALLISIFILQLELFKGKKMTMCVNPRLI